MRKAYDYVGKTALVTGASSGIGKEFACQLAARSVERLFLVARREAALRDIQRDLMTRHQIHVEVVAEDLAIAGAHRRVAERVASLGGRVDVLVNNAGFATYGRLETLEDQTVQEEIQLNCSTLVGLTTAFLPSMQAHQDGVVINVASTAAFQPLPYMAIYGATKAFVLSFTEALWGENRAAGVRCLALCPGATETPFFDRVGAEEASVGSRQTPETVVGVAFRTVDRGRPSVVSGRRNAALASAPRLAPRRQVIAIAEKTMRPRTDKSAIRHSASEVPAQ